MSKTFRIQYNVIKAISIEILLIINVLLTDDSIYDANQGN